MADKDSRAAGEAALREFVENRVKAIHARDAATVTASLAPDVVTFDALNPLRNAGAGAVRQKTETWLSWYDGPVGYEVRDLEVTAGDDVAFCHYLYRVSGTMKNGSKVDMWLRATLGFQKIEGEWKLVHEHDSVPFDAETGKASLDIKP